jgi:hypothetical protein
MDKVAVVILNWNGLSFLQKFLPGVVDSSKLKGVRIYVADNNSDDDSLAYVESTFPGVGIIRLDQNYGFAGGYNRALMQLEAEYFLLLNSDVKVTSNWLKPLIEAMDSNPLMAACSPKIKAFDQPDFFEYAGAAGGFIDKYGYAFCQGRLFESIEHDYGQYDKPAEVFWTTGACMMIRGPLFKLAGGFDDAYFAHFEEIDLCWRLKNRGYSFQYIPYSSVFHVGGGTLSQSSPRKTYLNFRNNLFTLYKNLPQQRLFVTLFGRLVLDQISAVRFLLKGRFGDFAAIIRAHLAFYSGMSRCRQFRKEEKRFITRTWHKEIYTGILVRDFFLRKKYTFLSLKWRP